MLWGRKRRVVSTARTRAIAAHSIPEYPPTVTAADIFNNGTDAVRDISFSTYLLIALATSVGAAPRESHYDVFDQVPWRVALCGTHTLRGQSGMMWFVMRVSIKFCYLRGTNAKLCQFLSLCLQDFRTVCTVCRSLSP